MCHGGRFFFAHHYPGSWGHHWSGIEIVESIGEGVDGKFWVKARGAEEIYRYYSLR